MFEASTNSSQLMSLAINGSELAVANLPDLSELEPALRSVALSDSPVVIRAPESVQNHLLEKLHQLGRRAALPLRICRSLEDADKLLNALSPRGDTHPATLGTWALFEVDTWPEDKQDKLGELLEELDLGRLHGRLRHERIPRVMAFTSLAKENRFRSALEKRISYFTIIAKPIERKEEDVLSK